MSWRRFFRRRYWDEERSRELEAYLEQEPADNIARGMTVEEAHFAARKKLGNPQRIREEIYRMNTAGIADAFWQDLRYGARLLRLNPELRDGRDSIARAWRGRKYCNLPTDRCGAATIVAGTESTRTG